VFCDVLADLAHYLGLNPIPTTSVAAIAGDLGRGENGLYRHDPDLVRIQVGRMPDPPGISRLGYGRDAVGLGV